MDNEKKTTTLTREVEPQKNIFEAERVRRMLAYKGKIRKDTHQYMSVSLPNFPKFR